jgi:hypothetical protein
MSGDPSPTRNRSSILPPLFLWVVFFTALVLQLFSPRLKIAHDSFVIPAEVLRSRSVVDPRALVKRERVIQLCSAVFAIAGASGLAFYYRRSLLAHLPGRSERIEIGKDVNK